MGIIYSCVSSELSFVKAAEEKTPDWCGRLADNAPSCDECRGDMGARRAGTSCGACTSSETELLPGALKTAGRGWLKGQRKHSQRRAAKTHSERRER